MYPVFKGCFPPMPINNSSVTAMRLLQVFEIEVNTKRKLETILAILFVLWLALVIYSRSSGDDPTK